MRHSFFHPCNPPTATAQMRAHTKGGGNYLPTAVKKAQATLRAIAEKYAPPAPLVGALSVGLHWTWQGKTDEVTPKTTVPDLDNLAKMMLDGMTRAGWWADDSQVTSLFTTKCVGPMAGISITATELGG